MEGGVRGAPPHDLTRLGRGQLRVHRQCFEQRDPHGVREGASPRVGDLGRPLETHVSNASCYTSGCESKAIFPSVTVAIPIVNCACLRLSVGEPGLKI